MTEAVIHRLPRRIDFIGQKELHRIDEIPPLLIERIIQQGGRRALGFIETFRAHTDNHTWIAVGEDKDDPREILGDVNGDCGEVAATMSIGRARDSKPRADGETGSVLSVSRSYLHDDLTITATAGKVGDEVDPITRSLNVTMQEVDPHPVVTTTVNRVAQFSYQPQNPLYLRRLQEISAHVVMSSEG